MLALIVIEIIPMELSAQAGLFLVALCPSGVTSNLFSFLAKANVELSVSLTTFNSLITPITLPVSFGLFITTYDPQHTLFTANGNIFSLSIVIKQLIAVTILPIMIGMASAKFFPLWARRSANKVKQATSLGLVMVIIGLIATKPQIIAQIVSLNSLAIMLLIVTSMMVSHAIATKMQLDKATLHTLVLEVGLQNAGTAMFVALSILAIPSLAVMPLIYGLVMNVPAFTYLALIRHEIPPTTITKLAMLKHSQN
jgi:BASS family bile acid:Na+ symporter